MTETQRKGRDSFWDTGYRETLATIWHVDPCKDGSDDSCGWSYPKLNNWQKERLWNGAWGESQNPFFLCCYDKKWQGTTIDAERLYLGMVLLVCRLLNVTFSFEEAQRMACERIYHSDCVDPCNVFCFVPGYHTNCKEDKESYRQEHFYGILCGVARGILDQKRHWWQHPKWHFWHWKLQIHGIQRLKRFLFSSCCVCGKGFSWHDSAGHVVSNQWDSPGPRWFRNEPSLMHDKCSGVSVQTSQELKATL